MEAVSMIVSTAKEFGAAIRARRKELGLTQAALAEFTGFSVSFLSDLENGKQTAELGKALYLANLLGLDAELRKRGDAG
jgi:y4mF family transcriptional regulator